MKLLFWNFAVKKSSWIKQTIAFFPCNPEVNFLRKLCLKVQSLRSKVSWTFTPEFPEREFFQRKMFNIICSFIVFISTVVLWNSEKDTRKDFSCSWHWFITIFYIIFLYLFHRQNKENPFLNFRTIKSSNICFPLLTEWNDFWVK